MICQTRKFFCRKIVNNLGKGIIPDAIFSQYWQIFYRIDFGIQCDVSITGGHVNGGMTDQISHHQRIYAAVDQHTHIRMPERMKTQAGNITLSPCFAFIDRLESGKFSTVLELAQYLKSDRSHVARTLSLVNLAPDIVTTVMTGKAPESVTLTKVLYGFPDNWQEQRKLLGLA